MKIVEFSLNKEELIRRANVKHNDGDFLLAIRYLKMALEKEQDFSLYPLIAENYYSIDATESAIEWYVLSLISKDNYVVSCLGLSECYIKINKLELAFIYINTAIRFDENYEYLSKIQEIGSFLQSDDILEKLKTTSRSFKEVNAKNIDKAKNFIVKGDLDEAKVALKHVSPYSDKYIDAENLLTTISLMENDLPKASNYANNVLEKNPSNVQAICSKAIMYKNNGDQLNSVATIKIAMATRNQTIKDKIVIATALCQLGAHKLITVYLKDILSTASYHYDFMILYAIALFNINEKEKALSVISTGLDIYDNDVVYLHIKNIILKNTDNNTKLPYINQLLPEDTIILSTKVQDIFSLKDEEILKIIKTDKEFNEVMYWYLKNVKPEVAVAAIYNLVRLKQYDLIKEFCLSTRIPQMLKMNLIKELVLQNYEEKVNVVFEGVFAEIDLKKIKEKLQDGDFEVAFLKSLGMEYVS